MADTALNMGLLGCGTIAQFAHLPAFQRTRRVRLVALCDTSERLLGEVGNKAGVDRLYNRLDQMLADSDVKAVLIAVPDSLHVPLSAETLRAGKHVLVEKPLGVNVEECRELARLVDKSRLVLQVGSMKRHDPGMAFAQQFVRQNLGAVLSVSGIYRDTQFRYAMQDSCLDRKLSCGHSTASSIDSIANRRRYNLFTQGSHLFDNLRFLAGDICAVTAQLTEHSGHHSWHGLLEFVGGGLGHFELTCKACGDWQEQYSVVGEYGNAQVEVSLPFYHRPAQARCFDGRTEKWIQPLGSHSNAYVNQLEAFAASVLDGQSASPNVQDGLAAVELLEAVEQSVERGVQINLEQCGVV